MMLDIFKLLDLDPDSSLSQIRKAYRKRRRELAGETAQLERLEAAYEQAVIRLGAHPDQLGGKPLPRQKNAPGFTTSQRAAMQKLKAAPGCNLAEAARLAGARGMGATEQRMLLTTIWKADRHFVRFHLIQLGLLALMLWVGWGLYGFLMGWPHNFFPDAPSHALAEWYSTTLVAAWVVTVVFGGLFLAALVRVVWWLGRGKRNLKRLGIEPASPAVTRGASGWFQMVLLVVVTLIALVSTPFLGHAISYTQDWQRMAQNQPVTEHLYEPAWAPANNQPYSTLGQRYRFFCSDGSWVTLSSREEIDCYEAPVQDAIVSYLPKTGLITAMDIQARYWEPAYRNGGQLSFAEGDDLALLLLPDGNEVALTWQLGLSFRSTADPETVYGSVSLSQLTGTPVEWVDTLFWQLTPSGDLGVVVLAREPGEENSTLFTARLSLSGRILSQQRIDSGWSDVTMLIRQDDLVALTTQWGNSHQVAAISLTPDSLSHEGEIQRVDSPTEGKPGQTSPTEIQLVTILGEELVRVPVS